MAATWVVLMVASSAYPTVEKSVPGMAACWAKRWAVRKVSCVADIMAALLVVVMVA